MTSRAGLKWYRPRGMSLFQLIAERIAENLAPDGSFFLNLRAHCEAGERPRRVARPRKPPDLS